MMEDEEYTAALRSELEGLQKNLATLRQERDEGKRTVRQLRTEQIFLKKQKEQREKYRELSLQEDQLQKQLEKKTQQKKTALQQLVDAKPGADGTGDHDVSEITFQGALDDAAEDADEIITEMN